MVLPTNFNKSEVARDVSGFGNSSVLTLLFFLFSNDIRKTIVVVAGLLIINVAANTIKLFFFKHRPNKETYTNTREKIDASAFPSIHSARTIYFSLCLSLLLSAPANIIVFTIPLITGISRLILRKHYLIDVLAGYILGGAIFFFTYTWII